MKVGSPCIFALRNPLETVTLDCSRQHRTRRGSKKGKMFRLKQAESLEKFQYQAENRCSRAPKASWSKMHPCSNRRKDNKERTILTNPTDDTIEMSLLTRSCNDSHDCKKLETCKQIVSKHCSRAAWKLSSLLRRPRHSEGPRHGDEVSMEDEAGPCPICIGPMSGADLQHPLQCITPHCRYNFCKSCIQSMIKASEGEHLKASDGSHQTKIFVQCPNCRYNLSNSISSTLILRTADMELPPSMRNSMLLHLVRQHEGKHNIPPAKVASMHKDMIETEIRQARVLESEFLKTKPLPPSQPQQQRMDKEKTPPRRHKLYKKLRGLREGQMSKNLALKPIEDHAHTTTTLTPMQKPSLVAEKGLKTVGSVDDSALAPVSMICEESFIPVNQVLCFYIDIQVNFAGLNSRLRSQV
eukprot:scaffold2261_cov124-Cylindrotheca_fusiformis.AAC.15